MEGNLRPAGTLELGASTLRVYMHRMLDFSLASAGDGKIGNMIHANIKHSGRSSIIIHSCDRVDKFELKLV